MINGVIRITDDYAIIVVRDVVTRDYIHKAIGAEPYTIIAVQDDVVARDVATVGFIEIYAIPVVRDDIASDVVAGTREAYALPLTVRDSVIRDGVVVTGIHEVYAHQVVRDSVTSDVVTGGIIKVYARPIIVQANVVTNDSVEAGIPELNTIVCNVVACDDVVTTTGTIDEDASRVVV